MQSKTSLKRPSLDELGAFFRQFLPAVLVLLAIFLALFYKSFEKDIILFSNDGPLGVQNSAGLALPAAWNGIWYCSWIGAGGGNALISLTEIIRWLSGPVGFAKFYEPISLLFLGVCAWTFFRTMGLGNAMCIVGGIAAALNSNYFSNACWGLGSRAISLGFVFLALAALRARRLGNPWLNAALAGLAVGMSVVEGADNGAILSLYVSAFVILQSFLEGGSMAGRIAKSMRLVLVAGFAVFIAMQSLIALFGFAEKGAVSAGDNSETQEQKWLFATQWSLPPAETLRVIIPGLYGYRMDGTMGSSEQAYWGRVGESPLNPAAMRRFSGSGEYAGILVVLLALWSLAASLSKKSSPFTPNEKKMIWFWWVMVVISVILAWGRYAPIFYKVVYSLPYFSSVRNPIKFMHPAHMSLMILFGYGLLGLSRRYLENPSRTPVVSQSWWKTALPFERAWVGAVSLILLVSAIGYLMYNGSRDSLVNYLSQVGFPDEKNTAGLALRLARYSIFEVGLYVVFLALSAGAVFLVMKGFFNGSRARWAAVVLGLILSIDLGRASVPWIVFWNYPYKYEIDQSKSSDDTTNPIVQFLKENTFEGRLVSPPYLMNPNQLASVGGLTYIFPSLYAIEWVQQMFTYYNVQSIEFAQDPRPPADKEAYMNAMAPVPARYWQLTNTRYILGMTGYLDALNVQLAKGHNSFRILKTFDIRPKPGVQVSELTDITAVIVTNGPLAIFEYTDALPRTMLYSNWQVSTNDDATLKTLVDPEFDPKTTVIISDPIPASGTTTNESSGTTRIVSYGPQRIEVQADATAPGVLLLNDRFDPNWSVTVDAQPAKLLRANFIMRGVQVPSGDHDVVFTYRTSGTGMKISMVAMVFGVVFCGLLMFVRQSDAETPATTTSPSSQQGKTPRKQNG